MKNTDCIFCKIVNGEISTTIFYQDDVVLGFDDIRPRAPQHKLIIPKRHISTVNDLETTDKDLLGHMILVAKKIASDLGISEEGYRLVFNCNRFGGQEVFHLHLHLLGGRSMHWPPG